MTFYKFKSRLEHPQIWKSPNLIMDFVSKCTVLAWLGCLIISLCLFMKISALTPNAKKTSVMVSINPNISDTSSLMCRDQRCRSRVDAAIQCHREAECLGFHFNYINMACLVCSCPVDPSVFNRYCSLVQGALYVIDAARLEEGMQNSKTFGHQQYLRIWHWLDQRMFFLFTNIDSMCLRSVRAPIH